MSDQGNSFINRTVKALIEELQVQHKKSTPIIHSQMELYKP